MFVKVKRRVANDAVGGGQAQTPLFPEAPIPPCIWDTMTVTYTAVVVLILLGGRRITR